MPLEEDRIRELPKSLQGIEIILTYLNERSKGSLSIRNISKGTELSMRVTKNILLQLEKFNQIERVVETNNILPKWKITKFGKKVIKEATGNEKDIEFLSREDELIFNITIPENIEKIKSSNSEKLQAIISQLNVLQINLSKTLGQILNISDPVFEDLLSLLLRKLKFLKQKITNLPLDPLVKYKIKRKDEKQRKVSKEEEKFLFIEIFFFNSLILNQIKRIIDYSIKLSRYIENEAFPNAFSIAKNLREEIRTLSNLFEQRVSLNLDFYILSKEELILLEKNKITADILDKIIDIQIKQEDITKGIEESVLKFIAKLNKSDKQLNNHTKEISENIPLYELYELILDSKPNLSFTIETLEQIINSLADNGYLSGIKIIQGDEDHYLKLVQFKPIDISKKELELISNALKLQNFTLVDMVGATGWSTDQVKKTLNHLSNIGILKYSKSYLQGERWFIVSK